MTIGQRIKAARKAAGFTQRELAERSKVATGTIQQYELGKRQPRIEQLRSIAEALEVPTFYLAGEGTITDFEEARDFHREIKSSELTYKSVLELIEALYGKHKTQAVQGRWNSQVIDYFEDGTDTFLIRDENMDVIVDAIRALTESLVEHFREPVEDVVKELIEELSSDEMRDLMRNGF